MSGKPPERFVSHPGQNGGFARADGDSMNQNPGSGQVGKDIDGQIPGSHGTSAGKKDRIGQKPIPGIDKEPIPAGSMPVKIHLSGNDGE